MKKLIIKGLVLFFGVFVLWSFVSEAQQKYNPYANIPVKVRFDYEDGKGGQVIFNSDMKAADGSGKKSKIFKFPAKVEFKPKRSYSVSFDLGTRKVFGVISVIESTQYTSVGSVRVNISDEQIEKALAGEVLRIIVNDPESQTTILEMLLGDSPIDQSAVQSLRIGQSQTNPGVQTCFIATAAFGSPWERHVLILRNFRDKYLLTNELGQRLVNLYYSLSPSIADAVAERPWAQKCTRIVLMPLVVIAGAALGMPSHLCILILTTVFLFTFVFVKRTFKFK